MSVKRIGVKMERYCACGDSLVCEISPATALVKILLAWEEIHSGVGHYETTREACEKAYWEQELVEAKLR